MNTKQNIKIGISSCLLGNTVRYDGGHRLVHCLRDALEQFVTWAPVCPEVESGLPVPREAMQLVGYSRAPRLVTIETGIDHTDRLFEWSRKKIKLLEQERLCGFIFKSRSPSCAIDDVKIFALSGKRTGKGAGIFKAVFVKHFPLIPIEDECRLQDLDIRESFIERVYAYKRWIELRGKGGTIGDLNPSPLGLMVKRHI